MDIDRALTTASDTSHFFSRSIGPGAWCVVLTAGFAGIAFLKTRRGQSWRRWDLGSAIFLLTALAICVYAVIEFYRFDELSLEHALHDTSWVIERVGFTLSGAVAALLVSLVFTLFGVVVRSTVARRWALLHWLFFFSGIVLTNWQTWAFLVRPSSIRNFAFEEQSWLELNSESLGAFVTLLSFLFFAIVLAEALTRRLKNGPEPIDRHDSRSRQF